MEKPPVKEIAEAVLSASAAIASLLLVFIAFVMARIDSLPGDTDTKVIKGYRRTAWAGIVLVACTLTVTLSAYFWLFCPGRGILYWGWCAGFPCITVGFLLYTVFVVWRD